MDIDSFYVDNDIFIAMNLDYLHMICRNTRKEVAEDYKNKIMNPIFPLSDDIIDIEIEDMRQNFMQKNNK